MNLKGAVIFLSSPSLTHSLTSQLRFKAANLVLFFFFFWVCFEGIIQTKSRTFL